jgi:hypothetical protein
MGCVNKEDIVANITPSAITQMDEEIALQSVRSDNSEQLHSSFFMWWEENVTQTFLTPPVLRKR